jgi:hypothetical protein
MFLLSGQRIYTHSAPVEVADIHAEQVAMVERVDAMFAKS